MCITIFPSVRQHWLFSQDFWVWKQTSQKEHLGRPALPSLTPDHLSHASIQEVSAPTAMRLWLNSDDKEGAKQRMGTPFPCQTSGCFQLPQPGFIALYFIDVQTAPQTI